MIIMIFITSTDFNAVISLVISRVYIPVKNVVLRKPKTTRRRHRQQQQISDIPNPKHQQG